MEANKRITLGLVLIITITPLVITPFLLDYFYFSKIFFVYIISSYMAIFLVFNRNKNNINKTTPEHLINIYIFLVVFSSFFSINYYRTIWGIPYREEGIVAILTYGFLFIVASRYYLFSYKHFEIIVFSATIVAIYGILQYFGYDPIPRDIIRISWRGRAFSTMGNPNFLGTYLTLMLPISSYLYIFSKKNKYLIISGIIYLSLLCTMTRGAWLGAFLGTIVLIFILYKNKYDSRSISILIFLFLFLIISILMNIYTNGAIFGRFLTIGKDVGEIIKKTDKYEKAGAHRIFIWVRVIELIKEKPIFGYGLETLDIIFTEKFLQDIIDLYGQLYRFDKAHNEYLHISVSTGIPSLIAYLLFTVSIIHKSVINIKNNNYIIPIFCSVIGYITQAFFNISVVSVAYIYWIFLGILLNFSNTKTSVY